MKTSFFLAVLLFSTGCSKKKSITNNLPVNGPVTFLTTGNLSGDDDDPAVAVDAQGNIHVIWFSDRDGTKDLYTVRSTGFDLATGIITWSAPIQITDNDETDPPPLLQDNFPSLLIDETGTFHLTWHRINESFASHILYMKSDGTAGGWASATLDSVTSGLNYDRFPNVVKLASNNLRIYFNSSNRAVPGKNDIYVCQSTDNGNTWGAPTEVASLNTASEQSTFPTIVKLAGNSFIAALVRWKLEPSSDFLDRTSDIFYASSMDGDNWTVEQITSEPGDTLNDLTPSFFSDHSGTMHLAWATITFGDPTADIVQMKVADRTFYPDSVHTLSSLVGTPDHSPEVIPLLVNDRQIYVMIWVRIATPPHNQVVYRVFSNL
ncbi:MAG: sialidase family protein [Candidatus Zixiibacteriota bacterium]